MVLNECQIDRSFDDENIYVRLFEFICGLLLIRYVVVPTHK